jgi:hypothetical protein
VRIFGGCDGGVARFILCGRSLRRLPCFLVLAAQLSDILTVIMIGSTVGGTAELIVTETSVYDVEIGTTKRF